ncbi:Acyl-CoA N-acyltransferase [Metarhizium guizhouense ARSEF 977]|uniref:Acyl-CoA N-acyltransferase n=1 Tax=Metarhizium guizhouense (strain ARSEF 977) TaxID=1276136 RepID=A0A0B4GQZ3_METGA|nr:Acyl-CoA N-acyltransferase [Metarhizium guizhouense ARSEF 977]
MTVQLRTATEADAEAIATLAADAFHPDTDTISRRLFPQHLQPANCAAGDALRLWRLARKSIKLTDKRINIIVAVDDDLRGQIVGFALWEIPAPNASDSELLPSAVSSPGLDESAFEEMQRILVNHVRKHFGDEGTSNMWHLDHLAVDPRHQRRGIGKLLLNWGIEKAKHDGRDCYLVATPAGKSLYESVGFRTLQELSIFDNVVNNGAFTVASASKLLQLGNKILQAKSQPTNQT